jgi:hypothetical protein
MRSPGSAPSIWHRLEALGDSEFNSAVSRVTNSSQAAKFSKGLLLADNIAISAERGWLGKFR